MTGPWWTRAKVGDAVVCVSTDVFGALVVGAVYMISEIDSRDDDVLFSFDAEYGCIAGDDVVGIRVVEVPLSDPDWFHCRRFRPAQLSGMSTLRKALNTKPVKEGA